MDVIELMHRDHEKVQQLLGQVERGEVGADSDVVDDIVRELSLHAAVEEIVVYPVVREVVPGGENLADTDLQEHQLVKELLTQIEQASAEDRTPLLAALAADVRHHVRGEEDDVFRMLREFCTDEQLQKMGRRFERGKQVAPTHPHPHAPNTPPGNVAAGAAAALVDRVRDAVSNMGGGDR